MQKLMLWDERKSIRAGTLVADLALACEWEEGHCRSRLALDVKVTRLKFPGAEHFYTVVGHLGSEIMAAKLLPRVSPLPEPLGTQAALMELVSCIKEAMPETYEGVINKKVKVTGVPIVDRFRSALTVALEVLPNHGK